MSKFSAAAVFCGLLASSSVCQAGAVLGVEGTSSFYKYDDVQSAIGYKLSADYRFQGLPLFAGFSYINTGFHDIDNGGGSGIGFSGVNTSVGYVMSLDQILNEGVSAWIKAGYYIGDAQAQVPPATADISKTSNGFSYGAGVDWMTNSWLGFRVGFEQLAKVKDFQTGFDSESTISLFSFGILFADPSHASALSNTAPAPVAPAPPPATTWPVEPVQPVAPPQPLSMPTATSAVTKPGAVLRGRPTAEMVVIQALDAGTRVELLDHSPNEYGNWWFVSVVGTKGWMLESDLDLSRR